jgi:hypothetical protein
MVLPQSTAGKVLVCFLFVLLLHPLHTLGLTTSKTAGTMNRRLLFHNLGVAAMVVAFQITAMMVQPAQALAFQPAPKTPPTSSVANIHDVGTSPLMAAYKTLSLQLDDFGVEVPVACWFPVAPSKASLDPQTVEYQHRISVRRIGQLLAGWDFIPELASRNFALSPTSMTVTDGQNLPLPTSGPVVLLAHGYLGSRFDLSHLAEELTQQGFICLSPEFPESLAASYDRMDGLDRSRITQALLRAIPNEWQLQPSSYGIVGHSLGCGTVIKTGDKNWARVCIAGFPRQQDGSPISGNVLFLTSMNDGAVSLARFGGKEAIPSDYAILDEAKLLTSIGRLPSRAALVFDRPDAPNHISFLSEGVNDAMIDLLSALLPVAQALKIPVLDFDRYKVSRDSLPTANVVHPLVVAYLKQEMIQ